VLCRSAVPLALNPHPEPDKSRPDRFVSQVSNESSRNYFGELALLYDAPRAATVTAIENVSCWCLDRTTFKTILMDSTLKQRSLHQQFLEQVPLLSTLSTYERLTIADALKEDM
jgi:cAMP-dependent protein kinase regulator